MANKTALGVFPVFSAVANIYDYNRVFNSGSPHNVPAGHGANLNELIAHYHRKNAEQDAKTRARMNAKPPELRQQESATLPVPNPGGAPPYSAVSPTK